ncbi:hypothetical protein LI177_05415 [bacterium 210820-DFI.6.37]|nr:hypothetical protein [bacterium 210820-DFI.6.37]
MSDYYNTCPFPKPKTEKKRKKQNGWKDKPNRTCYYTGKPNAERHEIFGGTRNRQTSIDMGFQVDVCPEIHRRLHARADEWSQQEVKRWRIYYQVQYMDKLIQTGLTEKQALDCWMALIGENYLWNVT